MNPRLQTLPVLGMLALAAALSFTACTTESNDEESPTQGAYAAIVGDWKITAATVNPVAQLPAIPGVPTVPTTANLLLVLDNCDKQATLSFQANGRYINTEGPGCNHADTGTWVRRDTTLYVTYDAPSKTPDTLTILAVSDTALRLRERNDDLPDRVMRTILWTLEPR